MNDRVRADEIDLNVRALSMGKLHHAMMGTAAVAIGTAAASRADGEWQVEKVVMSRSARVLMEGWVRVPGDSF